MKEQFGFFILCRWTVVRQIIYPKNSTFNILLIFMNCITDIICFDFWMIASLIYFVVFISFYSKQKEIILEKHGRCSWWQTGGSAFPSHGWIPEHPPNCLSLSEHLFVSVWSNNEAGSVAFPDLGCEICPLNLCLVHLL